MRSENDLAERSTFRFSHAKLIVLGTLIFTSLVGCSIALSRTLLARWLNPAYIAQQNQKTLLQLTTAVESLEEQNSQQRQFIALLQSIIAGQELPEQEQQPVKEYPTAAPASAQQAAQRAAADGRLRNEFESNESSLIDSYSQPISDLQELFFFPPVSGIITTPFRHKLGHYGVDIVAKEHEPIKCVADGVVVLAQYTVETGWVIVIQHNKDLVSVYKHNASLLKKVGNFVEAGDVVAIMGNSGELSTGPHLHFELWYQGNAVNPEDFITF